jgi:hypothetical protein
VLNIAIMNERQRNLALAGGGLAAGAFALTLVGLNINAGFDPAEARQQQVDACMASNPSTCDMERPEADYNIHAQERYVADAIGAGMAAGIAPFVFTSIAGFFKKGARYNPIILSTPVYTFMPTRADLLHPTADPVSSTRILSVSEYRRDHSQKANMYRLDDYAQSKELNRYFAEFMRKQEQRPTN